MAPNRSQEGLDQSEAERLRQQRRAEREEAKRQKRELARIEREMRGATPRWVLPTVLGAAVFVAVLVFAGFKVWGNAVVDAARIPFESAFERADRGLLREYAAADLRRIEELKTRAEARKDGSKATAQIYREADRLLAEALAAAAEVKAKTEFARSRFDAVYNEAVKLDIGVLLPELWEQVEQSRAKALAQDQSHEEIVAELTHGLSLLEEVQNDFARIKVLRQKVAELAAAAASFTPVQHAKVFPEEAKAHAARLAAGQTAIAAREWRRAIQLYQGLVAETSAIAARMQQAKDAASAAMRQFEDAMADARTKAAPRDAKSTWEDLVAKQETLAKAMAESDYLAVKAAAEEATASVNQMLAQIKEARNTLAQRLLEAREGFRQAQAEERFFEANLPDEWQATVARNQALEEAVESKADIVSQLKAAEASRESIDAIMARRQALLAGLNEVRDKLAVLRADPLAALVERNLPDEAVAIARISRQAAAAAERGDVKGAVGAYARWTELLGKAVADIAAMRDTATASARGCADRARRFRKGIDAFRSGNKAEIARLTPIVARFLKDQDYRNALPVLKQLEALIPAGRFTFDKPEVSVDNEHGLMWAKDGKGPGCFDGRQLNWHEAFRLVPSLDFAGHRDWRLPSEVELKLLAALGEAERARAFPNTPLANYWTGLSSNDPQQALAVDLASGDTILRAKGELFHVRVVRVPK